jgi:hypothetical protein
MANVAPKPVQVEIDTVGGANLLQSFRKETQNKADKTAEKVVGYLLATPEEAQKEPAVISDKTKLGMISWLNKEEQDAVAKKIGTLRKEQLEKLETLFAKQVKGEQQSPLLDTTRKIFQVFIAAIRAQEQSDFERLESADKEEVENWLKAHPKYAHPKEGTPEAELSPDVLKLWVEYDRKKAYEDMKISELAIKTAAAAVKVGVDAVESAIPPLVNLCRAIYDISTAIFKSYTQGKPKEQVAEKETPPLKIAVEGPPPSRAPIISPKPQGEHPAVLLEEHTISLLVPPQTQGMASLTATPSMLETPSPSPLTPEPSPTPTPTPQPGPQVGLFPPPQFVAKPSADVKKVEPEPLKKSFISKDGSIPQMSQKDREMVEEITLKRVQDLDQLASFPNLKKVHMSLTFVQLKDIKLAKKMMNLQKLESVTIKLDYLDSDVVSFVLAMQSLPNLRSLTFESSSSAKAKSKIREKELENIRGIYLFLKGFQNIDKFPALNTLSFYHPPEVQNQAGDDFQKALLPENLKKEIEAKKELLNRMFASWTFYNTDLHPAFPLLRDSEVTKIKGKDFTFDNIVTMFEDLGKQVVNPLPDQKPIKFFTKPQ